MATFSKLLLIVTAVCSVSQGFVIPGKTVASSATSSSMKMSEHGFSRRNFIAAASFAPAVVAFSPAIASAAPNIAQDIALKQFGDRIRKIAKTLDELEVDIFNEDWEVIVTYPQAFRSAVPVFTRYTDSKFPGEDPIDMNSRVALRYEVGRFYGAVERLKRAAEGRDIREVEGAFAQLSLAYDRYMKAGALYDGYDPITSTEKFYVGINDKSLRFIPQLERRPEIRDKVLLISGPDKGKVGTLIGVERGPKESGIVKLDNTVGTTKEIKLVPYASIAKTLD